MLKIDNKILVPTLALAVLALAGTAGAKAVMADDASGYPPIVEKLAEKFGLNKDDVKSVFDQERQDHINAMQTNFEDRLAKAVTDGVLTEDQKNALIEKFKEKQEERQQHHEEMQNWLSEQNIDMEKLGQYIGFGHHGMGHWHMMGN